MKDRAREQNEAPIFQGGMITKVYGMDGIYQRILRVLVELGHFPSFTSTPLCLERSQVTAL